MKIKNKKRFIRSLLVIMFLLFTCFHTSIAKTENKRQVIDYQVRSGQTLWSIAKEYTPNNKDIRQTIYEIKKLNDQDLSIIYPGQTIKVQVESEVK